LILITEIDRRVKKLRKIGVIGGGQLAQMMAIAAQDLGVELIVQTDNPHDPALTEAKSVNTVAELVANCDLITFENEFADLDMLREFVERGVEFIPSVSVLEILVDKYNQRTFLADNRILVPNFLAIANQIELESAAKEFGFPLVIKTRRHGYDGKGTAIIQNRSELLAVWQEMGAGNLLLEAFVPFERELAVMVARNEMAEIVCYPVVETQQQDRVCLRAIAPANLSLAIETEVKRIAEQIAKSLELVGILGIEFFLLKDGKIMVNEIAPRTHNSAHYSIEACITSQFSQLVRLTSGMPLGDPSLKVNAAVMINLLGFEEYEGEYLAVRQKIAELPQVFLHWYGKNKSLPGRKLGHATIIGSSNEEVIKLSKEVEKLWYGRLLD
jgi:5-(carboxyamino)imidazole ribonucleotide synthase